MPRRLCLLALIWAVTAAPALADVGSSGSSQQLPSRASARLAIAQISDRAWSIEDADVLLQRVVGASSGEGLQDLAASGDPKAETLLGIGLLDGSAGFARDQAAAAREFELASKAGFNGALVMLGFMYQQGLGGLPQDDQKAVQLFQKAADQGDAGGQMCLGDMYLAGRGGLPKDRAKAVQLYQASARQGDKQAEERLSLLGEFSATEPQDDRFVVLAERSDEVYVVPLESIGVRGDLNILILVTVYATEDESVSRTDSEIEVDCKHEKFRGLRYVKYLYFRGKETPHDQPLSATESAWHPLPSFSPVMGSVHTLVCENLDITPYVRHNLESSLPSLRARLKE